ncbi:MAG TPA: LamG domain-containing protein, partial [Vicinamibacterales bacterium]|nr:LamG domain-containing protein [Vicinamibacterales bacterium]
NHPNATFRGAAALRVAGTWHAASFGPLAADTWYHLAATYDGETLRAYVNGVLVTANTAPAGPPDVETAPLTFGRHANASQYFTGIVDDIHIYHRALDAAEIAALASR